MSVRRAGTYRHKTLSIKTLHAVFGATVCKTVRPMLSDRCPYVLSVPSVCLSCLRRWCIVAKRTVGWIKMKVGVEVGLGPGHIVLDGDSASPPPEKGGTALPSFGPCIVAKRLDGSRCHLAQR